MKNFIFDVLGLEIASTNNDSKLNPVMDLVLDLYKVQQTVRVLEVVNFILGILV